MLRGDNPHKETEDRRKEPASPAEPESSTKKKPGKNKKKKKKPTKTKDTAAGYSVVVVSSPSKRQRQAKPKANDKKGQKRKAVSSPAAPRLYGKWPLLPKGKRFVKNTDDIASARKEYKGALV